MHDWACFVFCLGIVEFLSKLLLLIYKNSNAQLSDPQTRISFLFARCRPTQPRCSQAGAGSAAAVAVAGAAVYRQFDD